MIDLTSDQHRALESEDRPIRVRDPETNATYVLVSSDVYDKARALFEEDGNDFVQELYPHVMEVFGREGWDDPAMDIYDELDPRRSS